MAILRGKRPEGKLIMTAANIRARLIEEFFCRCGARCVGFCPNLHYGQNWEADLMMGYPSGLVYEYEIKISRQDFFEDFKSKPEKHAALAAALKARKAIPPQELPNRLMYVLPERLGLSEADVPEYAGLIYVCNSGRLMTAKGAPVIHRHRFASLQNHTKSLSWRLSRHLLPAQYEFIEKGELT